MCVREREKERERERERKRELYLAADVASYALTLYVHVDDVLLQVEGVGEGFPAVVAHPRLHTSPPIPKKIIYIL